MYKRQLMNYLPHILREVREFKAILNDAEQPEMVAMWGAADDALKDQFVVDATENGVARWEKILGITSKATATLDERKFTILSRINEQIPFTLRTLEEALDSLCGSDGYSVQLKENEYTLIVKVALVAASNYNDVKNLLDRVVPANMVIRLEVLYNPHNIFKASTHQELNAYTHYQLRNEVFTDGN